ncbi:hypothetical protein GO013_15805 [Pseudodesulfovibrio sp. JC047]|uniref:HI1506-related protein n=1 Tax=Pseudodesulfovibrio sp. JC047 TaxID=2683199 RepID=UPI0013D35516|nr:HI1506-related protein [Pseudodesulfovibrio sp. JC047]NDV20876.1 hypothetical protein [Pseudodesulfovibrio sp. JC047]
MKFIEITSKREGFRRCNVRHSTTTSRHEHDRFTPDELKTLKSDPQLIVVEVEEKIAKSKVETTKGPLFEAPPMATKPENAGELTEAIVKAISELDETADYTIAGTPRVAALEEKLGYGVTGEEVTTAFEQYKKKDND